MNKTHWSLYLFLGLFLPLFNGKSYPYSEKLTNRSKEQFLSISLLEIQVYQMVLRSILIIISLLRYSKAMKYWMDKLF